MIKGAASWLTAPKFFTILRSSTTYATEARRPPLQRTGANSEISLPLQTGSVSEPSPIHAATILKSCGNVLDKLVKCWPVPHISRKDVEIVKRLRTGFYPESDLSATASCKKEKNRDEDEARCDREHDGGSYRLRRAGVTGTPG
jgi:hypothetical protein